MGTSSSHPGGSGGAWSAARGTAGAWSAGNPSVDVARVVAQAVAALAQALAAAPPATAQSAVARLGGLAAGTAQGGLPAALAGQGLGHLVGRPPDEVRAALVDWLAGSPDSRDADAVRLAAEQAVSDLMESAADLDDIVVDEARAERLIEAFVAAWLARVICRELAGALVDTAPAAHEARAAEIREYVAARLEHLLAGRAVTSIAWNGPEGRDVAARTVRGALDIFSPQDGP